MDRRYKYDAFISYRHTELDKFVAEKIHKYLESFKLPKNIRNKQGLRRTKIERVFRDKEELTITNNLEDPIVQALRDSEYLIVICSPRTKESVWCCKEIEKFIEFHGRHKILPVLIEGEPGESFPQELLVDEEVVLERGVSTIHRKDVEPLAADVRADSKSKMCKLIKSELLRLLAPMFGLDFDDLRQRHRERRNKKIMTATVAAAALGTVIGVAGVATSLKIKEQSREIEKNNKILLSNQAKSLAEKSLDMLEEDDRYGAISLALQSLTEYDGIEMPYTAEGKYALIESLGVYDNGSTICAIKQFETEGNIIKTRVNATGEYLLALDSIGKVYVWNVTEGTLTYLSSDESKIESAVFVGADKIACVDDASMVTIYDVKSGAVVAELEGNSSRGVFVDEEGKYLVSYSYNAVTVYDTDTFSCICDKTIDESSMSLDNAIITGDWLVYLSITDKELVSENERFSRINFVNIINDADSFELDIDYLNLDSAIYDDGIIYLSLNNLMDSILDNFSYVMAVDVNSKAVVWNTKIDNISANEFRLEDIDGDKKVIISNYSQLLMLNSDTGAIEYGQKFTNGIVNYTSFYNGSCILLDTDGIFIQIDIVENKYHELEYLFECNVDEIEEFLTCTEGYLIQTDNRVILYNYIDSPDRTEYKGEVEITDEEYLYADFAQEEAKRLGVDNYKRVETIVYSDDNKVAFVSFENKVIEIYNVANKKLINRIEGVDADLVNYLGKDKEGNIYIQGSLLDGYCFDSNYNLIAIIKSLVQVNRDDNTLVVNDGDNVLWEIPIYSTNELIERANDMLE